MYKTSTHINQHYLHTDKMFVNVLFHNNNVAKNVAE